MPQTGANAAAAPASLRVLIIGTQCVADSHEWHVMDALAHMGIQSRFFQTRANFGAARKLTWAAEKMASTLFREPERLIEKRLLATVRDFQPDFVLVIQGSQLSPKTVEQLRRITPSPIACWCQDALSSLGRQFMLGAGYDAVFVKDRYLQALLSRMVRSTSFHYLPEACNPRVHRSVQPSAEELSRFECDVMLAGTLYYYRQEILQQLSGVHLRIFGPRPGWLLYRLNGAHQGRDIVLDDKAKAVRAARICLNTLHFAEINGLNCRAFEIAGCGGFQMISASPAVAEHFEAGEELVTFDSADHLLEQVHFYLRNPQIAARIARRGQERAHREHTYEHRLGEILRTCCVL